MKEKLQEFDSKMQKCVKYMIEEFGSIRAGLANASVLDKITIDYYGTQTPVNQVGTISVPEPHMLVIQPWDASSLKEIEKAILKSDLGITPVNDGKIIRLAFPPLTEERRKEFVKIVSKKSEEAKVAIRGVRRDAMEVFKKMQKNSEITEDDLKKAEKDVQDLTDKFIKNVDEEAKKKEKEILSI